MIIIKIHGGLGNQMFCYIVYKKILLIGKEIYVDIKDTYKSHNGYELENIFNIKTIKADINTSIYYSDSNSNILQRVRRKIFGRRKTFFKEKIEFKYDNNIFNIDNDKYLSGYWQSIKYLEGIEDEIRKDFTFKNKLDNKNLEALNLINNSNSISIHIRRGDYFRGNNEKLFGNIATVDYYKKAMKIIEEKIENPVYFVFSNDMEWVKENIEFKCEANYIDWNVGEDSYKDMQLMSNCKHNIIANSTFSWWGAWLNNNQNKIVIAPKKWINKEGINSDEIELFYDDWILL